MSGIGAAIDGGQDVHEIPFFYLLVDGFEGGCGDSDLVLVTWLHLSQEIINLAIATTQIQGEHRYVKFTNCKDKR